ncbi:enhancer of mRNA-decapping protein 4 homolog isoform X1 [Anopheles albimanus]|uniref:enhancer of mRNA-decapping protein 4 homolog isoform X1 n=1 Tax=Anopheles albimanus TaxID=7167 RepID=UPI001641A883|nr:enhancer of mRNA-decapping protein 4 homolog isoform X1 [Anopheles albimanus]
MLGFFIISTINLARFLQRFNLPPNNTEVHSDSPASSLRKELSDGETNPDAAKMETSKTGSAQATKGSKTLLVSTPEQRQHSIKTSQKNVTVVCSGGKHDLGSSKIKLMNMVDYKWEQKHYPGRLIACHKECDVMAYGIKVTKQASREGMVRVVHLQAFDRVLIKGMSGEVLDIQFAHTSTPDCLLGIIEPTALHVHQVMLKDDKLTTTLKVKITDPLDGHVPVCDRISWCPYLRENEYEIDDFASQLLVWTRGATFQCYSINTLVKSCADPTNLSAWMLEEGGFKATDGEATITGSVFSADGSTLALSSTDGLIRFYQVYQHSNDGTPRCLHQWKPHGGKTINSFFFLDDHTETVDDNALWKHVITCAENNTEIKLWCCESWACLQTIRLKPDSTVGQPLHLKAEIDLSSTYLVLSDMTNRQLYVLQIRKGVSNATHDLQDQQVRPQSKSGGANLRGKVTTPKTLEQSALQRPHIVSIAEYPVSTPILSFSILYATARTHKFADSYQMRMLDDDDEEGLMQNSMVLRMFLLQPNSVQNCMLVYNAVPEEEIEPVLADNSDDEKVAADDEEPEDNLSEEEEEDEEAGMDKGRTVPASSSKESTVSVSSSKEEDEEEEREEEEQDKNEDDSGGLSGKPHLAAIDRTVVAAVKKLNDAMRSQSELSAPSVDSTPNGAALGATSTPVVTANKVNLMTPDSFGAPSTGGTAASAERPGNWKHSYAERSGSIRGTQYDPLALLADHSASGVGPVTTPCSNNNSSGSASTSGANSGSDGCTSDDEEEDEEEGGGNTSVASVAGSERVANNTDDPDDGEDVDEAVEEEEEQEDVEDLESISRKTVSIVNPDQALSTTTNGDAVNEQKKRQKRASTGTVVLNVSSASLSVEHFTKILTLDDAEPPTVREKIKSDDTVNPNVLSTLILLANATKQQQQQQQQQQQLNHSQTNIVELLTSTDGQKKATIIGEVAGLTAPPPPTANALEEFVNMINNRAAASEAKLNSSSTQNGEAQQDNTGKDVPPIVPPMPSAEMLASGGSSPSREVQQIMSTKGAAGISIADELFQYMCIERKDSYEGEMNPEDDGEEESGELSVRYEQGGEAVVVENGTEERREKKDEADGNGKPRDDEQKNSSASFTVGSAASKEETLNVNAREIADDSPSPPTVTGSARDTRNAPADPAPPQPTFWPKTVPSQLPKETDSSDIIPPNPPPPTPAGAASTTMPVQLVDGKQLADVNGKLDRMMDILLLQSRQIEQLNQQIDALKKSKNDEYRRYSTVVNRLQQTLPKAMESQFIAFCQQQALKTEEQLRSVFTVLLAQIVGALESRLPKGVPDRTTEQLRAAFLKDIQSFVLPPITAKIEGMQQMLAMAKRQSNASMIKETVQEAILSQSLLDTLSSSVSKGLRSNQEQIYHSTVRDTMLPGYERCAQELFRQLNDTFKAGLKEFMSRVEHYAMRSELIGSQLAGMEKTIRVLPQKLAIDCERTTAAVVQTMRQNIEKDWKGLQTPLLETIRQHIRQEIEKGFEAQASSLEDSVLSVVRSQAQTPAPNNVDIQEQIRQYLAGGQINKAFHKALLSNDLTLVEFVLERADFKQVFNPCTLEQTVLLSLIQQISADMSNHNDLKHKYLSDAIVSLNFQDPITKEHSPKVMVELINNSLAFMEANPSNLLCTSLKMLVNAVQFMGFKQF